MNSEIKKLDNIEKSFNSIWNVKMIQSPLAKIRTTTSINLYLYLRKLSALIANVVLGYTVKNTKYKSHRCRYHVQ